MTLRRNQLLVIGKLAGRWGVLALATMIWAHGVSALPRGGGTGGIFLVASDLHFNPMAGADAALVSKLTNADPTQWESLLVQSKSTAFSQYGEDTNWWLLQSSLDAMRTTLPHPAFILVTGDILAHRYPQNYQTITGKMDREAYRKFVMKTVEFVAMEFRKRFPNVEILVTPGNNDEECGNYSIRAGGKFLDDTSDLVQKLAKSDAEFGSSWKALGSYDVPHPTLSGIRIIALNTIFFSQRYKAARFDQGCAPVDSTAAQDELKWLESRLSNAQEKHEKVWLMFHIPPGIDAYDTVQSYAEAAKNHGGAMTEESCMAVIVPLWVPEWITQFDGLMKKYAGTISLSLSGHNHTDEFRLINNSGPDPKFVLVSPAISPIYRQNPAFRTVTIAKDGSLGDTSVYYLTNLDFASNKTRGEWKREYTFSQQWKAPRIDAATLGHLNDEIRSQQTVRDEWLKLYNTSSAAAYMPAATVSGFYCAITEMDVDGYGKCFCPTVVAPAASAKP